MSFDIFLQSFKDGEAAPGNPEAARQALEPYLAGAPDEGYALVHRRRPGRCVQRWQ